MLIAENAQKEEDTIKIGIIGDLSGMAKK